MLKLSENECISLINKGECFHAEVENTAFIIKIDEYTPVVCTAIHNGNQLRPELNNVFMLSEEERLREEAPYTDDLISSFPIVLIGNDSRFEYDLNKPKAISTHFKSINDKPVWKKALSTKQRTISHAKHKAFYNILTALIKKLEKQFKNSLVFDVNAFNYQSVQQNLPTFNIDTSQVDLDRWGLVAKRFEQQLNKIELPNIQAVAGTEKSIDNIGYLITHINARFENTLVLPLNIKKVYMDETTGDLYPLVLEELKASIKQALSETAAYFIRRYNQQKSTKKTDILTSSLAPEIISLDKKLVALCKNVETLNFINPINIASERKKFHARAIPQSPEFQYKQLNINPYQFREKLYKLPVDDIMDADIQLLYRHTIDNLANKIDLITSIGTDDFVYNSLKYYGEPSREDIANAEFILRAPKIETEDESLIHNADYAVNYYRQQAEEWGLKCKIEKSSRLVAKAMVNNDKRLLLINKDAVFSTTELQAYAFHELGIHMLTTINAKESILKVFSTGLTGNTHTQEGLAIFSEYCSGNLTLARLKTLALRVIAVKHMLEHDDFTKTYNLLNLDYGMSETSAFTLTTRVHRGGGFTKDYLYLKGFRDILNLSKTDNIESLLVGKTGLLDFPIITEMIDRELVTKPRSLFPLTINSSNPLSILDYLVGGIR